MNTQTQHVQNKARGGQIDFILKNGDSDDGSRILPPNNGKESHPCAVGQCDVNMSYWYQSGPRGQRLIDLGKSKRKITESKPSVMVERKCVFCKDRGSSYIRPDVTIFVLTIMVVILTVAMMHAHMKLSRIEEKLARMEHERSENKGKMQIFTDDLLAVEVLLENNPAASFTDETSHSAVMEINDVKRGSGRRRRDAGQKNKQKKPPGNGKRKNKKLTKDLIDQYCFDKIEGHQPISNEFQGSFGNHYHFKDFIDKEDGCYFDHKVAQRPKICKVQTINYSHKGSPLSFFVPLNGTNTTLLNITNGSDGEFTVQESGIFLMRFTIVMIDHDKNRSIGVFVDDTPVMACPAGGYQKPKELDNHRICSFNGILQMNKGDKLQLKTMEANTTVRIESKDKAVVKVTLLHRMSRGMIPK